MGRSGLGFTEGHERALTVKNRLPLKTLKMKWALEKAALKKLFIYIYFTIYLYGCSPICTVVHHTCASAQRPERGLWMIMSCHVGGGNNLGPLQKHQVILIAEPSLQPNIKELLKSIKH